MTRLLCSIFLLSALFGGAGCRREPPQAVDQEGHAIVDAKTEASAGSEQLYRQMLEEMRSFDQSVETWMAHTGTQPQNQPLNLDELKPFLKGRLAGAVEKGQLMDPAGNPYVILTLQTDSKARIAVSAATASKPELKDAAWGEYSPR